VPQPGASHDPPARGDADTANAPGSSSKPKPAAGPAGSTPADGTAPPGGAACGEESTSPVDTGGLDPFFTAKMKAAGAPGLAVAAIGGGKIKWIKGYGLANIEENRPVTKDTLFMLASVSKSITAVALMSLIQDPSRGLSLDQDVDDKLPFKVR